MAIAPPAVEDRASSWKAVLGGAGFTIVFMLAADLLARVLGSVSLAPGLTAVACFLAGMFAARLAPGARPIKPAIGSAAAIVLFGLAEIARLDDAETSVTAPQVGLFIVTVALMAFFLAMLGARMARLLRERRAAR